MLFTSFGSKGGPVDIPTKFNVVELNRNGIPQPLYLSVINQ